MFSVHGLLRYHNMEMGRDADTGGQIKYVVELAEELSRRKEVERVDLFTRLIQDKRVSADYGNEIEEVSKTFRIVRTRCGGTKYMRKELLWPFLDEYIDKTIKFIRRSDAVPDIVHGHYPDGGLVALRLSRFFGVPFVFTGHSLGMNKKQKLLAEGMKEADINKKYFIDHRIGVEEEVLENADLIVTSTHQEIRRQYGLYANHDKPRYSVIPPGLNLDTFYPYYYDLMDEFKKKEEQIQARASVMEELNRFFLHPDKPLVLALCRPDKRKNISGLIMAFGRDRELQAMANLAVFAGIRKNIADMEENERDVLTEMLLLMDRYDLYGKMAIPKKHDFVLEVPELYRYTASLGGVFVNVALTEPFGLTLIEASSCGLPIVATNDGGPQDIIKNCRNGLLVDATDIEAIAAAVKKCVSRRDLWKEYSVNGINGVKKHYTWGAHSDKYLKEIKKLSGDAYKDSPVSFKKNPVGKRLTRLNRFLICDIDDTLIGGPEKDLGRLIGIIQDNRDEFGFGVATGRNLDAAMGALRKNRLPEPDIIISSVGSAIHYRDQRFPDLGWLAHISSKWNRDKIQELLKGLPFLKLQEEEAQERFKLSYYMKPGKDRLTMVHDALCSASCRYNIIYSQDRFLDILPFRASKGKAIRYLSYKWEIPQSGIMVCGDSGNDEEMLRGRLLGVVVGNYKPELEKLKGLKGIYFAGAEYAAGIIEGLGHYKFIEG